MDEEVRKLEDVELDIEAIKVAGVIAARTKSESIYVAMHYELLKSALKDAYLAGWNAARQSTKSE